MDDDHDRLGSLVKRALETETDPLRLEPRIRRSVMAAAGEGNPGEWARLLNYKLALAGAACLLTAIAMVIRAVRPDAPHPAETYMEMRAEVQGGRMDDYWKKRCVEVRTRNGREGHIKVEARWPKRVSVIALNVRSEG